jgi:thymidylate synthase (FAD)
MLDAGVAKECARAVLPLNTTTRLYMSGTIRS